MIYKVKADIMDIIEHHGTIWSVAKKAGINQNILYILVEGHSNPTLATISKLCTALECKFEDLFEEDKNGYYV